MLETVSWVGVIVATIAAFALGAIWFGPLFSKPWMRGHGLDSESVEAGPPLPALLGVQLLVTFITAAVLALIIERFGGGLATGLVVGLMCGAGFVATAKLSDMLFSRRGSSSLYYIEAGNQLVSYALMGAIYGAFA